MQRALTIGNITYIINEWDVNRRLRGAKRHAIFSIADCCRSYGSVAIIWLSKSFPQECFAVAAIPWLRNKKYQEQRRRSLLELLQDERIWREYLDYKRERQLLTKRADAELSAYIDEERYKAIACGIIDKSYTFSLPVRRELSKLGTSKKRIVYTFSYDENMVLKLLSYLLYSYDNLLCNNCYSFRRDIGAKRAFVSIAGVSGIDELWCFKTDISNYFNSIDIEIMTDILNEVLSCDTNLCDFITTLIAEERCVWHDEIITERKGVMAGTPISPFLANLYLKEMDEHFARAGIVYARYSDDIVIFAPTEETLMQYARICHEYLAKYKLTVNPNKEQISSPKEPWSFLGFEYSMGEIDISAVTVKKLMGKIRRAARSVRRWKLRNNVDDVRALKVFNKKFNRKFYSADLGRELCWTRWFFPLITKSSSLKRIDAYMQQYQRYLVTGKHNKSGYSAVPYELMKECGYRPLVSAYFADKHNKLKGYNTR